jgi:acyl-CoA synthetase (NDP forming)
VTRYGEWRRAPEGVVPALSGIDTEAAMAIVGGVRARGGGWAHPDEAQRLAAAAGIAVAPGAEARNEDAAVIAAGQIGYPVVIKAFGPAIVHKTEVGAIRLHVGTEDEVRRAWRDLATRLGESMTGVLVQAMAAPGIDMLIGAVEDPAFGPVVACALGGTTAELFADSAFRLAPLTDLDARAMVEGLRSLPLLRGYRGAPPVDEAALRDALLRLSALVVACPDIQEMDVNPLRILPRGVSALDVRIRITASGS